MEEAAEIFAGEETLHVTKPLSPVDEEGASDSGERQPSAKTAAKFLITHALLASSLICLDPCTSYL